MWREATKKAEEEWARVNAHWMAALSPTNVFEWFGKFHAARFSVWAKRGVQVVWSDGDVEHYDLWLLQYANATLATLAELFARNPPPFGPDSVLLDARNRLGEQIQYWKAEARRYRAEQEADRASGGDGFPLKVSAGVVKRRKRLIGEYRNRHNLSAADFGRRVGISENASDKRRQLLDTLGVTWQQWYQEL